MEPNKLENEFKDKLEQRAIQPSAMAWDRLDAMLSVTEEKKQPKKSYWMYIAASFLGFLLIGALLLKMEGNVPNGSDVNTTTVVSTDEPSDSNETESTSEASGIEQTVNAIAKPVSIEAVAENNTLVEKVKADKLIKSNTQRSIREVKEVKIVQQEAVAVQEVQTTPEQETEKLLAMSLSDEGKASKKSKIKVDANSLLSTVEGELDNNFRSEVLQKVVKNYNTVKTSVANRNYQ